jgi:glycine/D-amino acid oxidase-like deaminating enzyme
VKDYATYSFWLENAGDLTPRPALDGSIDVDIAILGAGFTGLWTAYHLLKKDPSLKVAVVEAEIAGFGASGRNGGWCYAGFPESPSKLLAKYGYDAARAVSVEMVKSLDNIGDVCREEGIDAHYHKGGEFEVARADYDLATIQGMYDEYRSIGFGDQVKLLDKDEANDRIRIADSVGAFWFSGGASIQPARLARGLAEAVERHGGTIYEQTRVTDYTTGSKPSLITERGIVNASVIVLAGEAYLSQLPKTRRAIIPITSRIVITEPLSDAVWDQIGWKDRDVVGGFGLLGGYLNHTADRRLMFGAYRGMYPYDSKITDAIDRDERVFAHARDAALTWFPMLKGMRFTHSWGGVLGMPRDHMPTMSYDRKTGVATGRGYTGEGVCTTNLSGRVLADLITETDSDLLKLPMVGHESPEWEREPFRWMGVNYVFKSRLRYLAKVERDGKYPSRKTLAQRLFDF